MRTIPTDLLRALVTVVDLGGYTRAGERLGRTQPAVSLQIRRLQDLLGVALLERDGATPRLTEAGEICLGYARRILALHDDMLHRLVAHGAGARIRIGFPTDFADHFLPHVLTGLQDGHDLPGHVEVVSDLSVNLLRDVRAGSLDIALAMTPSHLPDGAMASWREAVMWVGAGPAPVTTGGVVMLVAYPEGCLYRRTMLALLQQAGRMCDVVYTTGSLSGLAAAVRAGMGVSALSRRLAPAGLSEIRDLPELPDMTAGLYLGPRAQGTRIRALAARLADALRP